MTRIERETGVAERANRMFASALRDNEPQKKKNRPQKNGVYTAAGEAVKPAPDGYIRRSPVQALAAGKGCYRARIVKRVAAVAACLAGAALVLYALGIL